MRSILRPSYLGRAGGRVKGLIVSQVNEQRIATIGQAMYPRKLSANFRFR